MTYRTVADVFGMPAGPVYLPGDGKWWATRTTTGLDVNGRVTVQVADGRSVITFTGSPEQLRGMAAAIVAQVDGAEANDRARGHE